MARVLLVLPDAARLEARLMAEAAARGFVDESAFITLGDLMELCSPLREHGKALASPLLIESLIARAAPTLAEGTFGKFSHTLDFAVYAADVFAHLEGQAATPDSLWSAAQTCAPRLRDRVSDLVSVWRAVLARLEERSLVHPSALPALCARHVATRLPDALAAFDGVELREVHDVPPSRLAFLEALATALHARGKSFTWWYPASGSGAVDVFVTHAVKLAEQRWAELDAEIMADLVEAPLSWVAPAMFEEHRAGKAAPTLAVFSAATPRDEALEVARRVRRLVLAGTPPDEICVTTRDLADEKALFAEAFASQGIPLRVRAQEPLSKTPLGRYALSLLSLIEGGFSLEAMLAVLQSRYAPRVASKFDAVRWLEEAGVRDDRRGARAGRGAYDVRLEALHERTVKRWPEDAAAIDDVRARSQLVIDLGSRLPTRARPTALLGAWWQMALELGLETSVRTAEATAALSSVMKANVLTAIAREQAAFDALNGLVKRLAQTWRDSGLDEAELERADFAQWLSRALDRVSLRQAGARVGAVHLLDVTESAGLRFAHTFVTGLQDGRFPGRSTPARLLSDDERQQLNRAAKVQFFRLGASDGPFVLPVRAAEDRLLFHLALCSAERVSLSFPRTESQGKEALPSPYLDALKRIVSGFEIESVGRASTPRLEHVLREQEFRERAALEWFSPPASRQTAVDALGPAFQRQFGSEPWVRQAKTLATLELDRARFFARPDEFPGPFSGGVTDAALRDALATHVPFDQRHPVSATELGVWGNCRFQGFGRYVLGLDQHEESDDEISSLTQGTFFHEALRSVVPALQANGLWPAASADESKIRALMEQAVGEAAKRVASQRVTGHPVLWKLSQERAVEVLTRFIRTPSAQVDGLAPREFELDFGKQTPLSIPAAMPGERPVFVRGQVDRVDASKSAAVVIDYKLNGRETSLDRQSTLLVSDFQLPLYAYVLRQQFGAEVSIDAAWIGIRGRAQLKLSTVLQAIDVGMEELLATDRAAREHSALLGPLRNLANEVHRVSRSVQSGNFGPVPADCRHCQFKTVCRIGLRPVQGER